MANELRASTAVAIDLPRTGVSDLPYPAGNPPNGQYRVIGTVADLRRSYRGQGGLAVHAHTITVRDHHGRAHTVAVTRPAAQPAPRIGTDLRGEIKRGGAFGPRLEEAAK